jgi:hypothetical protein
MHGHKILHNLTIRQYGRKVYDELDVSQREEVVAFLKTLLQNISERSEKKFLKLNSL